MMVCRSSSVYKLYDIDRQSQPNQQRCCCWNSRIKHLLFADDLVLHLLSRAIVFCYQAAIKTNNKKTELLRLSRNARQCRLYCSWVAIHCNSSINSSALAFTRERTRRLIQGLAKQTHSCMNFIDLWWQKGSFQTRKAFNFKIGLGSDPHLWPRILNIDWKNIISGASSRDGSFGQSTRCDTSRQCYISDLAWSCLVVEEVKPTVVQCFNNIHCFSPLRTS